MNEVYIIAEMSANHGNDINIAKDTIYAAKEAGADCIKFQTYKAESLSLNIDNEIFGPRKEGLWKGIKPFDLYKDASMPYEWQPFLAKYAQSINIDWFSSPFDFEAVDMLETINCAKYKIASFEICDIPLIRYVAKTMKPMIISTGIATLDDISVALDTCYNEGNHQISLLKCTSSYPAPYNDINLKNINWLKNKFKTPIGLSDHTLGIEVCIAAVSLGASIIEKHFILDRSNGGPDSLFSINPKELKNMVTSIRNIEQALGHEEYKLSKQSIKNKERGRSLYAVKNISKGQKFTENNIKSLRPANGLHPIHYDDIINRYALKDINVGTPLSFNLISKQLK